MVPHKTADAASLPYPYIGKRPAVLREIFRLGRSVLASALAWMI
jgi:hypothetical protein